MTQYPFEKMRRKLYQLHRQKEEIGESEKAIISDMIMNGYDIRDGIMFGGIWLVEPSCNKSDVDVRIDRITRTISSFQEKRDEFQGKIEDLERELREMTDGDSVKER